MASAAAGAVGRIAYVVSDIVVDSQPALPATSAFSSSYPARNGSTIVVRVPFGGDPGSTIVRHSKGSLVSYTTNSNSGTLSGLLVHLTEISTLPVVLHVLLTANDLSDVLLLRSSPVPFFLLSTTAQHAHDNALLASRLAKTERKAVVHAFYSVPGDIDQVEQEAILPFLLAQYPVTKSAAIVNDDPLHELYRAYESAALSTLSLVRRVLKPLITRGSSEPDTVLFTLGNDTNLPLLDGVAIVSVSLLNPLPNSKLLAAIPPSTKQVIVLEQTRQWNTKWSPLFLQVVSALQEQESDHRPTVRSAILGDSTDITQEDVLKFIQSSASSSSPSRRLLLGSLPPSPSQSSNSESSSLAEEPHVPKHESSYTKILTHLFANRLQVVNSPSLVPSQGEIATSPEFALGRVRGQLDERQDLVASARELLQYGELDAHLHSLLSKWILAKDDDGVKSAALGEEIVRALESTKVAHPAATRIVALKHHFTSVSRWIIGSDAWSYDLGSSGLHHAIASGLNINVLILDTLPYSSRNTSQTDSRRKHDVGLYAMNHGDVYVASTAVYSSYSQVLQSLVEADRFPGPSVVLAYLPYSTEATSALEVLKETKLAVDAGYWPLYRWNPSKEAAGAEPFSLDSDAVKNDLQQFLNRQNHLSQLVRSKPQLASELVSSLGETVKDARKKRAQQTYEDLLTALDAPPLLVLYASDGGAAEKVAKRLVNRGKARGLDASIATLDSMSLDALAQEEHVVFITSVAGQGEPPQNGRKFFKSLNAAAATNQANNAPLSKLKYSVFGMGDSHYWPRPEDAHYYNKPAKDLDVRLALLGASRVADLVLGDDQDADGPETGYKLWEPTIWQVLGVDSVEVTEAEPEPITNEHIKAASGYLRGTIAQGLADTTTGAIAPSDGQLTKFHGIYQQDDRDIRDERLAQGVEPAYSFMIRVRMPGGVCTPAQWLKMDEIADEHGSGTFKITTRQTFQFHGVIKKHLKSAIQGINRVLLDTLAACGDVNRNVVCSSIPTLSKLHEQVYEFSKNVSNHLVPRTSAYHEIWLDKKMVAGEAVKDFEPLYGEFYLPRKFKVAVAVPPTNDVDVFANDLGFIAIVDEQGELAGFNVSVGGGMGVTHGNKKTYPRIGDVIGFCTVEQGKYVAEKVMLVQRDNGNRVDRKNARLKYTIDRMGLDVFKADVEKLLGYTLLPARPYTFDRNVDDYGWSTGQDGKHHFTMFIENGRIQDEPEKNFKTGLKEIAKIHKGAFRLTTNQHLLVSDVAPEDMEGIKTVLAKYKLDNLSLSGLRLSSSACVAFPTCGLAMAESERYLPILIDKVEKICEESGLRNDAIIMRMTGCPNGCARPYVAEIAFVGKAPGTYSMLLGGGYYGQRMNKIYRETVTEPEILAILGPMIKRYALERLEGEHFGDFTIRAGYIAETVSGMTWYEGMGGEGKNRQATV